jgi:hypothetical protein
MTFNQLRKLIYNWFIPEPIINKTPINIATGLDLINQLKPDVFIGVEGIVYGSILIECTSSNISILNDRLKKLNYYLEKKTNFILREYVCDINSKSTRTFFTNESMTLDNSSEVITLCIESTKLLQHIAEVKNKPTLYTLDEISRVEVLIDYANKLVSTILSLYQLQQLKEDY